MFDNARTCRTDESIMITKGDKMPLSGTAFESGPWRLVSRDIPHLDIAVAEDFQLSSADRCAPLERQTEPRRDGDALVHYWAWKVPLSISYAAASVI